MLKRDLRCRIEKIKAFRFDEDDHFKFLEFEEKLNQLQQFLQDLD